MAAQIRAFYGWRVVAAAFVVAVFGWGIGFYGPPVYLAAIQEARGWSVGLVSGAVTLHFLAGVAVVANLPKLHGRFGVPSVTGAGALCLALGVLGWALAGAPWQLYLATLLSGAGWVTLGAAAVNAIVAPWFVRRRPAALATAYNGASIGGVIFSPLWVALIGAVGFPVAAAGVGSAMVAVIAALALMVLSRTPEAMGQRPDGDHGDRASESKAKKSEPPPIGTPWRDRRFQTLAGGMALSLFAQIGLIAHLVSMLRPALGPQGAGFAAGLSTAAAIGGRTLVGWLMKPGADRRVVVAVSLAVQVAGCGAFILAGGDNAPLMIVGVLLFGVGIGNATSLPPLVAQVEFAKQDVGRVVALIVATAQAAYAFAPATFGLLREAGAEWLVYAGASVVQLMAILAYLSGRRAYLARPGQ